MDKQVFTNLAKEISHIGQFFAERGWSPATSSNYSARLDSETIAITRSGIDKFQIQSTDIIVTDLKGRVIEPAGSKASAETLIHTTLYNHYPKAGAVLHTHSVLGTRLSLKFQDEKAIRISGYELLKAFSGNTTHDMTEEIPILDNDQDMEHFSQALVPVLNANPNSHGFLIAGHGLYTWGQDLFECKRHIEAYEFLFQCLEKEIHGI